MNPNIFSDLRKPGLVTGESLSLSTKIDSVLEKYLSYIMTNWIRSIHMKSKTVVHAFMIAKEEEKGLLIVNSLSKETTYPITGINSNKNTSSKWCSIHSSFKYHYTLKCRLHL